MITTSGSGFDDFVRDGVDGVAVKPDDAASLARAIVRLLHDEHLRLTLGHAAAQAETTRASEVLDSFVTFFDDAVAGRRSSPRA